jgi:hypothetical protein
LKNATFVLPIEQPVGCFVGAEGAPGEVGAPNGKAGNGAPGAISSFYGVIAAGGEGGTGAHFDAVIRNQPNVNPDQIEYKAWGYGGYGGEHTTSSTTGGMRGRNGFRKIGGDLGQIEDTPPDPPTDGSHELISGGGGGSFIEVRGGGGGGGGGKWLDSSNNKTWVAQAGADAVCHNDHVAPGQVGQAQVGGRGAGANLAVLTGVNEYAGGGDNPNGAVVIKVS